MSIFQELNEQDITIILVTHEPDIATYAKRIITMKDGNIIQDDKNFKQRNAKADIKKFSKKNVHVFKAE